MAARLEIAPRFPLGVDSRFDFGRGKRFIHGKSIIAGAESSAPAKRSDLRSIARFPRLFPGLADAGMLAQRAVDELRQGVA